MRLQCAKRSSFVAVRSAAQDCAGRMLWQHGYTRRYSMSSPGWKGSKAGGARLIVSFRERMQQADTVGLGRAGSSVAPQPVGRGEAVQGGARHRADDAQHGGGGGAVRPPGHLRGRPPHLRRRPQGDHRPLRRLPGAPRRPPARPPRPCHAPGLLSQIVCPRPYPAIAGRFRVRIPCLYSIFGHCCKCMRCIVPCCWSKLSQHF